MKRSSSICRLPVLAWCAVLLFVALSSKPAAAAAPTTQQAEDVLTQHNDNLRTGANLSEKQLNAQNVNAKSFGKLFSVDVKGNIYAQPLYVSSVAVHGGPRAVVYVATELNNVYAFDAVSGDIIWEKHLGQSMPATDITHYAIKSLGQTSNFDYKDLYPDVGVTSTPVIDPATETIFLVAKTKEGDEQNPTYHYRLHTLDIKSGNDIHDAVEIAGSVDGTGADNVGGKIIFNSFLQLNRPGLLLANAMIYVAFGSHGDCKPYHGWIFGYKVADLQAPPSIFCTTPRCGGANPADCDPLKGDDGIKGGVWQSGNGLAADEDGNIYCSTGDGAWDGKQNFSDSFLKLSPDLKLEDWFTPWNHQTVLDVHDIDLGSGGPVLLPDGLMMGGGKEGKLFVLRRSHLGNNSPSLEAENQQIVQGFQVTKLPTDPAHASNLSFHHLHGGPVLWNTKDGLRAYIWGEMENLKAYKWSGAEFIPQAESTISAPLPGVGQMTSMPGGILAVSADNDTVGSGIVWASIPLRDNANRRNVAGVLRAFDASDITKELWNSEQNASRDELGVFAKYCAPTIANGRVYMATFAPETGYPDRVVQTGPAQVQVYGLIPPGGLKPAASSTKP